MLLKGFPDVVFFSMEIRTVALYCCFSPCLNKMQLPSFLFPPKKKKETDSRFEIVLFPILGGVNE